MNPQDFLSTAPGQPVQTSRQYWAFIPDALPPQITWPPALVSLLGDAARHLALLAEAGAHFPNPNAMVRAFVRQEAVLSSRIEGTHTTLEQLYTFEAVQLSYLSDAPDAREVYNYVQALDYGLHRLKTLPISLRLIRELHAILMKGVRGEHMTPGEFRRTQNWIGPPGSTLTTAPYVPPPADEMLVALDQLEKFIHTTSDLPPLERIALIHYQFEAIHPFLDGNGRVGRLLITLLLCEWKLLPLPLLYLSAYFEANRQEYYARLLAVSRRGDWESWLRFFLTGVHDQAHIATLRVRNLQALRKRYRSRLQSERNVERLMHAVDFLIGHPIATIRQMQRGLEVSDYKIAQRYVLKLERAGILREITGYARNRIYQADEIWRAIEGPLEDIK
jgi:Fic family protein